MVSTGCDTGGIRLAKRLDSIHGNYVMSAQLLEVSLIRSRNRAPSPKGYVVNGQMTKASNKYATTPPPCTGSG